MKKPGNKCLAFIIFPFRKPEDLYLGLLLGFASKFYCWNSYMSLGRGVLPDILSLPGLWDIFTNVGVNILVQMDCLSMVTNFNSYYGYTIHNL